MFAKFCQVLPALVPVGLYQQVQHSDLRENIKLEGISAVQSTLGPLSPITSSLWIIISHSAQPLISSLRHGLASRSLCTGGAEHCVLSSELRMFS